MVASQGTLGRAGGPNSVSVGSHRAAPTAPTASAHPQSHMSTGGPGDGSADTSSQSVLQALRPIAKQKRRIQFSCDDDALEDIDPNDASSVLSDESFTLRDRQDAINTSHPFGIRIWKPAIYKKKRSVEQAAEEDIRNVGPNRIVPLSVKLGNVCWALSFGLVLWSVCFTASVGLYVAGSWNKSCIVYASSMRSLSFFFLWPFGKYVQLKFKQDYLEEDEGLGRSIADYLEWETRTRNREGAPPPLFFAPQRRRRLSQNFDQERPRRLFGRGKWSLGRVAFYFWFWLCLTPFALLISAFCWLSVVMVPMARIIVHVLHHLRTHPLALSYRRVSSFSEEELTNQERYSIILCTFRVGGLKYYKFTVGGTNIIILNLLAAVGFTIADFYFLGILGEAARFFLSLLSIVPLANFIGQAVASISAQSSMSMGATINAFFSTLVEVFLYLVALRQGKGELVEGSITGSIMAGTILLPGLSMCAGALKTKTQRFNPMSTGATSTMLLFAIVGVFAPTFWYQIYGSTAMQCNKSCFSAGAALSAAHCMCRESPALLRPNDYTYVNFIRPFAIICAVCLAVGYIIGLFFTLRTHASSIWATNLEDDDASSSSHDVPNWGRTKSYVILLSATVAYAIIAEILVDSVDFVLESVNITQKMLGITIFALVPNSTEFINAISFAIYGNVSLSLEIGSAYALQVCMLQIPALVLFSLPYALQWPDQPLKDHVFALLFPRWDLLVAVLCVLLYQNVHTEGKSNYFKGSVLLLAYIVLTSGFYFDDELEEYVREGLGAALGGGPLRGLPGALGGVGQTPLTG